MSHVLLIEDNPADAFMAKMMIEEKLGQVEVHHVVDGEKALAFISKEGSFSSVPTPDLILVDLNLPGMNGFSVMAQVNQNPTTQSIPMIVLTTSSEPSDREQAMQLGAKEYLVKTDDIRKWKDVVHKFAKVLKRTGDEIADTLKLFCKCLGQNPDTRPA